MKDILKFLLLLFQTLSLAGSMTFIAFFSGILLYYVVEWNLEDIQHSLLILARIMIVTVISFYMQRFLNKRLTK